MSSNDTPDIPLMLSAMRSCFGSELLNHIQRNAKILVVGAGGIGCELLKNLALCGFGHVEVIDLDTIDVSNLNRQLLFRSQHVGQPKCTVACEVARSSLVPSVSTSVTTTTYHYKAHHGNVCDNSIFNVQFVAQFDLVLNALDNVAARRRVNRLCLAANNNGTSGVPMIEAGTTGYLGQVTVIQRNEVMCYECRPQETPKVYPICTIRSTPSMPVHTIVWAKECYKLLFGEKVQESMLYEEDEETEELLEENAAGDAQDQGGANNDKEPSVFMAAVRNFRRARADYSMQQQQQEQQQEKEEGVTIVEDLARKVLHALYHDEIVKQLNMNRYKTARKTPVPLTTNSTSNGNDSLTVAAPTAATSSWSTTKIWTQEECAAEFIACLVDACNKNKNSVLPEFDKDDELAMRFVTAASNLRNYVFGITPLQSYYSAKGIAGNIIPAIATTNAIVAGLQVLQAFHILKAQLQLKKEQPSNNNGEGQPAARCLTDACRYINCVRQPSRNGLYLTASQLEPPNPQCFVCRNATVHLSLQIPNWTLKDLLDKILKQDLGFVEPAIFIEGNAVWEEADDDDDDGGGEGENTFAQNLVKRLADLPCGGIQHGTVLLVEDYSQDLSVEVVISHVDVWPKENNLGQDEDGDNAGTTDDHPFKFKVGGSKPVAVPSAAVATSNTASIATAANGETDSKSNAAGNDDDDDDDDVIEVIDETTLGGTGSKAAPSRKRRSSSGAAMDEEDLDSKKPAKKPKLDIPTDCEVIEINDD